MANHTTEDVLSKGLLGNTSELKWSTQAVL